MSWRNEIRSENVATLHSLGAPADGERMVRWCLPATSALVLGSAQKPEIVNKAKAEEFKVDIVKRRSGGGAVLVEPHDILWCDVFVPAGDDLWKADVGEAFWWLGDVWAETLKAFTPLEIDVHKAGLIPSAWSKLVCFAGMGPGEVTVAGRKVVGISQKRTREGALFQCALFRNFRVDRIATLLALSRDERLELTAYLRSGIVTSIDLDADALVTAFHQRLPG